MISENEPVDGSWELTILIPDINENVRVRVKGDLHVGGVLHKAVDQLQQKQDWSDHMLWWPEKNIWLSHTRTTLDQYGVQSNSTLELVKVHNNISIMLPSLQQVSVPINFSADVFSVVIRICKELSIRFPEELSLQIPLTKSSLKSNQTLSLLKNRKIVLQNDKKQNNKEIPTPEPFSPKYGTMKTNTIGGYGYSGTLSPITGTLNKSLSSQMQMHSCNSLSYDGVEIFKYSECMKISCKSVFESGLLVQPKNLIQRARLNCSWLDSSRSLMEQGVRPDKNEKSTLAPLHLRFKFKLFYDLNLKYDTIRIHQLYEQARWDLLSGRVECTEDEMVMFAALQLQCELRTEKGDGGGDQLDHVGNGGDVVDTLQEVDEVDMMLSELEDMYLGDQSKTEDGLITEYQLEGSLRISRLNKLGMKNQKRLWCFVTENKFKMAPTKDEMKQSVMELNLSTVTVKSDVSVATNKFFIRLIPGSTSGKEEIRIQLDNKEEYANWMAGLKLAAKGKWRKTGGKRSMFDDEVERILEVLRLQSPGPESVLTKEDLQTRLGDCTDYVSSKILKKSRAGNLRSKIGDMHGRVRDLVLFEAKKKYVELWSALEGCGVNYVLVKMDSTGSTKEDVLGIASNRVVLLNASNGELITTQYYSEMRSWHINWDAEKVILDFKNSKMVFRPVSTNCKTVVELVGGYVFLNQRTADKNQELNAKLFHKLTGALS